MFCEDVLMWGLFLGLDWQRPNIYVAARDFTNGCMGGTFFAKCVVVHARLEFLFFYFVLFDVMFDVLVYNGVGSTTCVIVVALIILN